MFTCSIVHWLSLGIILSIIVSSQCNNDSTIFFSYEDYLLASIDGIAEEAPTIVELPSTVGVNLDDLELLPELTTEPVSEVPELPPTFPDVQIQDSQDSPVGLDFLDPATPVEILAIDDWLSDVGLSYNHSDITTLSSLDSLPSTLDYEYALEIDNVELAPIEEDAPLYGTEHMDSDIQLLTPPPLPLHLSRNAMLADREGNQEPRTEPPVQEPPRAPEREPQLDICDRWIKFQRKSSKIKSEKKQLWTPDDQPRPVRKLWNYDGESPPNCSWTRRALNGAAALSLFAVAKGRKRERLAGSEEESPPRRRLFPPLLSSRRQPTMDTDIETYEIIHQPETIPISQEQLVAEVKSIYDGLVTTESKCIEADTKQTALAHTDLGSEPKFDNEEWQALLALHRTLIYEHHGFFLASQHPSASPALRHLASKYAMPARMWHHGIYNFLELLKQQLPASHEHMVSFIYFAYSMLATLYETIPRFEETWMKYLGHLGHYRMTLEDDEIINNEVWTGITSHWYAKAFEGLPTTGGLYHRLPLCAPPNQIRPLFDYPTRLTLPWFTELADDIHQRIADFLSDEDLIQLSMTCKKIRSAYKLALRKSLKVKIQERSEARLGLDNWTTQATLSLSLDPVELLGSLKTDWRKSLCEIDDALPSTMIEPLDPIDDWRLSLINFDLESAHEEMIDAEALPLHKDVNDKQFCFEPNFMFRELLGIPSRAMVMMSQEENGQRLNSNDEIQSLDNQIGSEKLPQTDNISAFGNTIDGRLHTQDEEQKISEISTPSMTDTRTIIKSSPDPKTFSPDANLPSPSRMDRGTFTCTQCTKSFPRMCELRKHAKNHTKGFHCPERNCTCSFSTQRDLTRHEKGPHKTIYGGEEYRCPHLECQKLFSRKDNLKKHVKRKHK